MLPSVRNRRLAMVSPRRGLGKQSRRIPSDGGQGLHTPFFNTLRWQHFDSPKSVCYYQFIQINRPRVHSYLEGWRDRPGETPATRLRGPLVG